MNLTAHCAKKVGDAGLLARQATKSEDGANAALPGALGSEVVDDWRLDNARHLRGLALLRRPYMKWSESWDHDHCAACWAKFAEFEGEGIQHEGYATPPGYHGEREGYDWVCITCFDDLKNEMGWTEQGSRAAR
jgi:hypothetical protein